jgi:MFS family permease
MGFWTIGPVLGSLGVSGVNTLTLAIYQTWQSQFVICGMLGLVVFAIAFLFLRELAPALRDQLMVRWHMPTKRHTTPPWHASCTPCKVKEVIEFQFYCSPNEVGQATRVHYLKRPSAEFVLQRSPPLGFGDFLF